MELDRFLDARGIRHSAPTLGTTIGNPPGQGHTVGSNHYREVDGGPRGSTGQARDYGTYGSDCDAIAAAFEPFAKGPNYIISELIWTHRLPRTGVYYKRGVAYTPSFTLAWQHRDHDHVAIAVGRHLPGVVPVPSLPKGFLMALTDAQQGDVYNWLHELRQKAAYGTTFHPNYGDLVNDITNAVIQRLKQEGVIT